MRKNLIEHTAIESLTKEGKKHAHYHRYTLHTIDDCNRARSFQADPGMNSEVFRFYLHYAHLVREVQSCTYSTPAFDHALHNARLIEAVTRAAARGERLLEDIESSDGARATIRS